MSKKYCIICKKRGVFLGTDENYGFFSMMYDYGLHSAPLFTNIKDAVKYATDILDLKDEHIFFYAEFDVEKKFISCVDLIKEGYGDYTGDMISNLPNYVDTMQ
jgi:hypothetical protein